MGMCFPGNTFSFMKNLNFEVNVSNRQQKSLHQVMAWPKASEKTLSKQW